MLQNKETSKIYEKPILRLRGNNNESHITVSQGHEAEINHADHKLRIYETNPVLDVVRYNDLIAFENTVILDIRETQESQYKVKVYLILSKYSI